MHKLNTLNRKYVKFMVVCHYCSDSSKRVAYMHDIIHMRSRNCLQKSFHIVNGFSVDRIVKLYETIMAWLIRLSVKRSLYKWMYHSLLFSLLHVFL